MSPRYDAVVIGAGLGGLAAAAKLARAGLAVRLFERHVQPGGYATSFVRGRFEFDVSLHALSGVGRPGERGSLWPLLEDLGVQDRVELLPIHSVYRAVAPGLDLRVPVGVEAALEAFADAFPHERAGLRRVVETMLRIRAQAMAAVAGGSKPSTAEALLRYPALAHAASVPASALLDAELSDPLARLAVSQLWGYFGLPPTKAGLLYFASGTASYLRFGGAYPRGKSQALSNALGASIRAAGGEITLGEGVRRILTQSGRVCGVLSDGGEHCTTRAVVSNASPQQTSLHLLGRDRLPSRWLRRLAAGSTSLSSVCVYLGLAASAETLGLQDHEVFLSDSADMDAHYRSYHGLADPQALLLSCYNTTDPDCSPPGTCIVSLVALSDGDAWLRVPAARYVDLKQRFARALLDRAERMYPGLSDHVEVLEVSTPLTNLRYTGNPGGSIYGWANTPEQNPAWRLGQRAPLRGLWFAGAWTQPGGGYEPCIGSGRTAALGVLSELGVASVDPGRRAR